MGLRSLGIHWISMKSAEFYRFHSHWFAWNLAVSWTLYTAYLALDFIMKSRRFHGKDLKNTAFSGILWNLADFMKSGRFHGKDLCTAYLACNRLIMYICIGSDEKYSIQWYTMKSGIFHGEIQQISWWNLVDFMKSGEFHEIWWDFMHEIWQISWQGLIHCILALIRLIMYICVGSAENTAFSGIPWNPADFMKSGEFHEIQQISSWNLADFIHEIRQISWLILRMQTWNDKIL